VGVTDRDKSSDKSKWQLPTKKKETSKKRPKLLIRIALKKLKNIFNYLPLVRAEKRISDDQIWNRKPPSGAY
jgi:hypothetical protein